MAAVRAVIPVTILAAVGGVQILGGGSVAERASLGPRLGKPVLLEEMQLDARAAGDEIDAPAGDSPPNAPVINATEGSVTLPGWYGRMGNNILQLVNAILFCQVEGFSTLRLPDASQKPFQSDMFDLPREIKITPRPDLKLRCNFRKMKNFYGRCMAVTKSVFRQTAAQHLLPLMNGAWQRACQDESAQQEARLFNGLTIHLRSGDTRKHLKLPQFSYASCSFFKKVILDHGFKSARVITEKDMSHPCIPVLREELGGNLAVQSGSLAEDSCAIMHARHLAVGSWSTFSQVLELLNERLEANFWPVPRGPANPMRRAVCNPAVAGGPLTYVYQVDGMQDGYNRIDDARSADYFARLPLENVTLGSVCDDNTFVFHI